MIDKIITLDCDWAPDFILENVAKILQKYNVKSTWFITNDSPIIEQIKKSNLFELGIHPNFNINSTQGKNPDDVLNNLTSLIPNATSIRTHSLFQSSNILEKFQNYGLKNDSSIFLPNTPEIIPHYLKYFNLMRFPYYWEDDHQMLINSSNWSINDFDSTFNGLKIFNFHPIHIYLNSMDYRKYESLKNKYNLQSITEENIKDFIEYDSIGSGTFFSDLIKSISSEKTLTLNEFSELYAQNL
jgi:hypothetical protein